MENLTGKQIGAYQIVAPLGEGGMAAVYKAYQPATDRYVALKILPRHFASDPQFIGRFQQEAKVLAKLQHPHILPIFDFGEADDYTYIVMPFIEGGTLVNLMRGEPLPLAQIRRVISQVGDALEYAHLHSLIHRDVKPSNILIDERGNCLLMDFGLAKIVEGSLHLTTSGMIMGTPAYMSPEQGLGEGLDTRTDVYSLGVILYEMAVGRVPYKAETPMAVIVKHIHDPLPLPRALNVNLPESVERVILKSLAKNPNDRFGTAGEMVNALQAAIPEIATSDPATLIPDSDAVKKHSAVTKFSHLLWRPVLSVAVGFAVGALLGLILGAAIHPFIGIEAFGAIGGLSVGLAWRRIESSVSRRQILTMAGIWMFSAGIAWIFSPLLFIMGGLVGWFSGLVLKKTQPALTRKQIIIIAFGWWLSWMIGVALFVLATSSFAKLLSAFFAILAILLGGAIGSWVMFAQYHHARSKD
ncbi:MAG: protein kinase [Anaerolineales bacterium]|nr:protein kinase [Anaerolineales bacterium]